MNGYPYSCSGFHRTALNSIGGDGPLTLCHARRRQSKTGSCRLVLDSEFSDALAVGLFNLGSTGQSTGETASASRMRFKVPLGL